MREIFISASKYFIQGGWGVINQNFGLLEVQRKRRWGKRRRVPVDVSGVDQLKAWQEAHEGTTLPRPLPRKTVVGFCKPERMAGHADHGRTTQR